MLFAIVLAASTTGGFGLARAAAKERLYMPFECTATSRKLSVKPSATTVYDIVGPRTDQLVTACHRDSDVCTSLMVHRFEILCGNTRVPWMYVAQAASTHLPGRRWIERGRMGIIRPGKNGSTTERWMLPAGYAPLGEVGARVESATPQPAKSEAGTAKQEPKKVAETNPVASQPPAVPAAAVTPLPPSPVPATRPVVTAATAPPVPGKVIEAVDLSEVTPKADLLEPSRSSLVYVWLSAIGLLLGGLAIAVRRGNLLPFRVQTGELRSHIKTRVESLKERLQRVNVSSVEPASPSQAGVQDPALASAAWQAASLLDQIEQAVDGLERTTPLRDVLQDELDSIHKRLVATRAAALDGGSPEKAASQFRALIRELERVRRIANSAATSFSNPRLGSAPPQTKGEAYALLGVNSDVSEGIVKKIVDALRMTWHPDLAKNEEDRLVREDRIKQINIAWDLICDKRHAA
jgi:hypothetical protein